MMFRQRLLALALPVLLVLSLLVACNGESEPETAGSTGQLTDPRSVPTASPWAKPPDVIFLEPGAIKPLGGGGQGGEPGEGGGEVIPGQCGKTYTVRAGDYPSTIAEQCGVELQALLDANPGLDPTNLQIGQELTLP